ncbi:MAG: hypothetical protein KJO06_00575 [Gemmatimonadetes bacterium]|nr:hypothetical protein [Gemmatimonadota bacterium]
MTDERKYQEEEVKEIFDLAASNRSEVGLPTLPDEGLTLSQLEEVGAEVGMEPGRIAEAAFAVHTRREVLPRRTFAGVPISAGRVVDLPRAMTDREWGILVGELRETFGAKGHVASHLGIREWTNGNLHAFLEPTATGDRLRLGTEKGNAAGMIAAGAAILILALFLIALFVFEELGRASLVIPVLMALLGSGTLVANVIGLPRWAHQREEQFEYIAGRVGALIGETASPDG